MAEENHKLLRVNGRRCFYKLPNSCYPLPFIFPHLSGTAARSATSMSFSLQEYKSTRGTSHTLSTQIQACRNNRDLKYQVAEGKSLIPIISFHYVQPINIYWILACNLCWILKLRNLYAIFALNGFILSNHIFSLKFRRKLETTCTWQKAIKQPYRTRKTGKYLVKMFLKSSASNNFKFREVSSFTKKHAIGWVGGYQKCISRHVQDIQVSTRAHYFKNVFQRVPIFQLN